MFVSCSGMAQVPELGLAVQNENYQVVIEGFLVAEEPEVDDIEESNPEIERNNQFKAQSAQLEEQIEADNIDGTNITAQCKKEYKKKPPNQLNVLPIGGAIDAEKRILNFAGVYPEKQLRLITYKNLRGCISITLSYLLEISILILILLNLRDLGTVMGALMLLVQQTGFISKVTIFYCKGKVLERLDKKLRGFASQQLQMIELVLLEDNLAKISKVGNLFRVSCILCCTFFGAVPFLDKGYIRLELPMPGYFPYEIENKFKYYATYLFQVLSLYIAGCLNSTIDVFNCKLITVATSLFEILMKRLNDIGCETIENQETKLKECIYFHNKILGFIKEIEDLYSYIVFSQFAASVIVICSTAFQIVIVPVGSGEFLVSFMYLINMILEVALYCWYGHNIRTMSESLGTACYMSEWYKTNTRIRRMIIIFMERTKKPVTLTAAKLFPLSLTTLTMILRSSYSYFAVLQQVYSEK